MDFEKRGKWLNVLPFGVGQYQNYQENKALLFLGGEALLLGATLTTEITSQGNKDKKKLQNVELASFIGFLIIYSWGVWDAFDNYDKADKQIIKQMEKKLQIRPKVGLNSLGLELALVF